MPAQEEDKAKDWLLQYKHVAFAHGMFRAATVVLLLTQLAGISTAFTSLIRVRGCPSRFSGTWVYGRRLASSWAYSLPSPAFVRTHRQLHTALGACVRACKGCVLVSDSKSVCALTINVPHTVGRERVRRGGDILRGGAVHARAAGPGGGHWRAAGHRLRGLPQPRLERRQGQGAGLSSALQLLAMRNIERCVSGATCMYTANSTCGVASKAQAKHKYGLTPSLGHA